MRRFKMNICMVVVATCLLAPPVYAKMVAVLEQAVITIDIIESDEQVITTDGAIFKVVIPEVLKRVKAFKGKSVRVLYIVMGEKNIITKVESATAPPFDISNTKVETGTTGSLK